MIVICLYCYRYVTSRLAQRYAYLLVFFYTIVRIILFLLVPAILRLNSNWYYDRILYIAPHEITTVYLLEFISYSTWAIGFVIVAILMQSGKRRGLQTESGFPLHEKNYGDTGLGVPTFIFIILVLYLASFGDKMFLQSRFGESGIGSLIEPVAFLAGPAFGLYAMSFRSRVGTLDFLMGLVVSVAAIGYSLLFGVRGQALFYGTFLVFIFFFCNRSRFLLIAGLVSIVAMVGFHAEMTVLRADKSYTSGSVSSMVSSLFSSKPGSAGSGLLMDTESRLGEATRLSVAFVRLYDSGQGVGFRVIGSALLAPVPRVLMPNKPEPGSSDGTKTGMGMYVIQDQMRGEYWNMSDFVTGAHAYWELGFVGVLLFGFVAGVFISFFTAKFNKLGMFGIAMAVMALKPWAMESKLWVSEIILQLFHLIIPLLLIWYLVRISLSIYATIKKYLKWRPQKPQPRVTADPLTRKRKLESQEELKT